MYDFDNVSTNKVVKIRQMHITSTSASKLYTIQTKLPLALTNHTNYTMAVAICWACAKRLILQPNSVYRYKYMNEYISKYLYIQVYAHAYAEMLTETT